MTTLAATPRLAPTLADRFITRPGWLTNTALITAGAALTGVLAQVQIPLWPVPVTGQTLAVLLVGASLGARRGALSLTLYALLGLAGLPVFAGFTGGPAAIMKPSFGFVIGFIAAAAAIGWLAERRWDRKPLLSLLGFLGASLIPFAFGLPYMAMILGTMGLPNDIGTVFALGFTPFIVGGVVKWLIAAGTLPLLWKVLPNKRA